MTTQQYLSSNLNAAQNAIRIGTCTCKNDAYADLEQLDQNRFDVMCSRRGTHNWNTEISLAATIAHLEHPGQKTRKRRLLAEIQTWYEHHHIAPELHIEGHELVQYNPDQLAIATVGDALSGEDQHRAAEQALVRYDADHPPLAIDRGESDGSRSFEEADLPGEPLQLQGLAGDGVLVVRPSSSGPLDQATGAMLGIASMVRQAYLQHGPQIARDAPSVLWAWYTMNPAAFCMSALIWLPKYFVKVPEWITTVAQPLLIAQAVPALQSAVMQRGISNLLTEHGAALRPLTDGSGEAVRQAMQETVRARMGGC